MSYRLKIVPDQDATSPRDSETLGTMVCWHSRHCLGDKHSFSEPGDFRDQFTSRDNIILPLYLYDHSGLVLATRPFSCPWDSGQVGWIYTSKEKIREYWNVKHVTTVVIKKTVEVLELEVAIYNRFLSGDVYGYILEDMNEPEEERKIDSCWGFYGDDPATNGMADYIGSEILATSEIVHCYA